MSSRTGRVHVATTIRHCKNKVYQSHFPADLIDIIRRSLAGEKFRPATDAEGRPVAVDVYPGNTGDPTTVPDQVEKLRQRCGLSRVVLVGDRGMLTEPQIGKLKQHPGRAAIRLHLPKPRTQPRPRKQIVSPPTVSRSTASTLSCGNWPPVAATPAGFRPIPAALPSGN
ncbi:MAG: transposase [Acidobacteriota bacterium]